MVGENFIDLCVSACMHVDPERKKSTELFSNICMVLNWYIKETPKDSIPVENGNKLELAFLLANYRLKYKTLNKDIIIDKISSGKFKTFVDYLENMDLKTFPIPPTTNNDNDNENLEKNNDDIYKDMPNDTFNFIFNTIHTKRKACEVLAGKKHIQKLLNDIECGNFVDDDEIIERWETCISQSYSNYMNLKRHESIEKAESLDILNDNITPILDKIRSSTDSTKTLKSGYGYLDSALPCGGFEDRRLYLIGGTSGVGKSTKLINLICNAVTLGNNEKVRVGPKSTYLYITAENLIDESWIRFYCCLTNTPHSDFIQLVNNPNKVKKSDPQDSNDKTKNKDDKKDDDDKENKSDTIDTILSNSVKHVLNTSNSNVIFKYVEPKRTSVRDVESIVDMVASENNLRGLYVDYLDLIRVGGGEMELRHELGLIAQSLKNISITYSIPVITATQLNRSGYAPDSQPTLIQMSESMEKVDNSDFVLFLQQGKDKKLSYMDPGDNNSIKVVKPIRASILKNRSGKEGETTICEMPLTKNGKDIFNYRIIEQSQINTHQQLITKTDDGLNDIDF